MDSQRQLPAEAIRACMAGHSSASLLMTTFADHFSRQAPHYARYRPRYPRELFAWLSQQSTGHDQAWDVGTGSGQAAIALRPFFKQVTATDPSAAQLAQAVTADGIRYVQASAEASPLSDQSADLITVAQALHWFDLPQFYAEVRRVARPGALLAAWTYQLMEINPAIDRVISHYYKDIIGPYWPQERQLVDAGYQTIDFPFAPVSQPNFYIVLHWALPDVLGYLQTWSATQRYRDQHAGQDPVARIEDELAQAWAEPEQKRQIRWRLPLRCGRVEP